MRFVAAAALLRDCDCIVASGCVWVPIMCRVAGRAWLVVVVVREGRLAAPGHVTWPGMHSQPSAAQLLARHCVSSDRMCRRYHWNLAAVC